MIPPDPKQLLGGYAAGILTGEERKLLFEAALRDQDLFDELATAEPFRELMADGDARAQLLSLLNGTPSPSRRRSWWPIAALAGMAAAVLVIGVLLRESEPVPAPDSAVFNSPPRPGRLAQPAPQAPAMLPAEPAEPAPAGLRVTAIQAGATLAAGTPVRRGVPVEVIAESPVPGYVSLYRNPENAVAWQLVAEPRAVAARSPVLLASVTPDEGATLDLLAVFSETPPPQPPPAAASTEGPHRWRRTFRVIP